MAKYFLEGSYVFKGMQNRHHGVIEIEGGNLIGHLLDLGSEIPGDGPTHDVEGEARVLEDRVCLTFRKHPRTDLFVPIDYQLVKHTGGDIEGNYHGTWSHIEDGPTGVGVAHKEGMGQAVALERENRGRTRASLRRRE